jgi:hypothetical protein
MDSGSDAAERAGRRPRDRVARGRAIGVPGAPGAQLRGNLSRLSPPVTAALAPTGERATGGLRLLFGHIALPSSSARSYADVTTMTISARANRTTHSATPVLRALSVLVQCDSAGRAPTAASPASADKLVVRMRTVRFVLVALAGGAVEGDRYLEFERARPGVRSRPGAGFVRCDELRGRGRSLCA